MIGRRFGPPRRCARLNPTQCRSAVRRDRVIDRGCDSIFAQRNEAAAGDINHLVPPVRLLNGTFHDIASQSARRRQAMPTAAQRLLSQAEQNGWSMTVDGDLTTTSATTAWDAVKTLKYGANVAFSESGARLGTALLTARAPSIVADD